MFTIICHRNLLSRRYSIEKLRVFNKPSTTSLASTIGKSHFYSALSHQEEEDEKKRVELLSKYEKEIELRKLDKDIARLNTLRGINTGELYTFRGKFKALARDYGMGFMAW